MTKDRLSLLLAALLVAHSGADAAQKVFRCGPDGRTYSQTPCKDGYEVNADDKRSAEQRKAAEDSVKREEKQNEKTARERQAKEAAAARPGVAVIANPSAAKPAVPPASAVGTKKKQQPKKPDQG